jgi:hypothetical protein
MVINGPCQKKTRSDLKMKERKEKPCKKKNGDSKEGGWLARIK